MKKNAIKKLLVIVASPRPRGNSSVLAAEAARLMQQREFDNLPVVDAEGRPVGLSGLLMELPDPRLQSLLVAVDETSAARGDLGADERLGHLADALRRRAAGRVARASARTLKTTRLDSRAEAELLERLVAQRRAAQGMTEPKDG